MQARLEHIGIWVTDLERMCSFYVRVMGGRAGQRYHNPATGFSSYFISFGSGSRIELMHRSQLTPQSVPPAAGYAHVALSLGSRAEVDAQTEALRRAGVTVESSPRVTGDGYYEAVILDPEGNRIELMA